MPRKTLMPDGQRPKPTFAPHADGDFISPSSAAGDGFDAAAQEAVGLLLAPTLFDIDATPNVGLLIVRLGRFGQILNGPSAGHSSLHHAQAVPAANATRPAETVEAVL